MNQFIKLHNHHNGEPVYFRATSIEFLRSYDVRNSNLAGAKATYICCSDHSEDGTYSVKETPEEVFALLAALEESK